MKSCFILPLLVAAASPAAAGVAVGAPLNVLASEGTAVLFDVPTNRTGVPTCATATTRFAIPANTDAGRAMISILLTAQARGKSVAINGTGNCNLWGDSESVNYIKIQD